jgi:chemotaxis protein CheY-P-specific phosphatase CheC
MAQATVQTFLSDSAQKVLETMFFALADTVSTDPVRPLGDVIAVTLTFQGAPPGRCGLCISEALARTLAGNFMGSDDPALLPVSEVTEVIAELTNILCGAALTGLETNANFELSSPEATRLAANEPGFAFAGGATSVCRFEFPEGALVFFLAFEGMA